MLCAAWVYCCMARPRPSGPFLSLPEARGPGPKAQKRSRNAFAALQPRIGTIFEADVVWVEQVLLWQWLAVQQADVVLAGLVSWCVQTSLCVSLFEFQSLGWHSPRLEHVISSENPLTGSLKYAE